MRAFGFILVIGGSLGAVCLFWATVFDGAPVDWRERALWGTLGFVCLFVAVVGAAVLDGESGGE